MVLEDQGGPGACSFPISKGDAQETDVFRDPQAQGPTRQPAEVASADLAHSS